MHYPIIKGMSKVIDVCAEVSMTWKYLTLMAKAGKKKNLLTGNHGTKFTWTNFLRFVSEIKSEKDLV